MEGRFRGGLSLLRVVLAATAASPNKGQRGGSRANDYGNP